MSTPAACSMRAISTASAGVMPSSPTQSLAEMRTEIGFSVRPDGAHRAEHLERPAHAVLEAAAVLVGAGVGQRRDEGREQVAVRHVQLEHVEAAALAHLGAGDERVADAVHVGAVHRLRRLVLRRPGHVGDRDDRPVAVRERRGCPRPSRARSSPWRRNGRAGGRSSPRSRRARSRRCASRPPRARACRCRGSRG